MSGWRRRARLSAVETRVDACVLWARALIVGSLAFFLGVVGHVTADGLLPGPAFLTALLAAVSYTHLTLPTNREV